MIPTTADAVRYEADLPLLVGPLTDITTALATQVDPVLHESAERLLPLALTWPLAAILTDDIQDAGLYDEVAAELRQRLP